MIKYVCGFMFSEDLERVVLIRKNKPDWQKGLLNGVGGKIEEGEKPHDAMAREFEEETGVKTQFCDWYYFHAETDDSTYRVKFFFYQGDVDACKTAEEEEIGVYDTSSIPSLPVIPNLQNIIPKAVSILTPLL